MHCFTETHEEAVCPLAQLEVVGPEMCFEVWIKRNLVHIVQQGQSRQYIFDTTMAKIVHSGAQDTQPIPPEIKDVLVTLAGFLLKTHHADVNEINTSFTVPERVICLLGYFCCV